MSEHQRMIIGRVTFGAGGDLKDVKYVSNPPSKPSDAIQPLAWTSAPPSVPGYYWCKRIDWPDVPPSVEFIRTLDRLDHFYGDTRTMREKYKDKFLWAGPLTHPPLP